MPDRSCRPRANSVPSRAQRAHFGRSHQASRDIQGVRAAKARRPGARTPPARSRPAKGRCAPHRAPGARPGRPWAWQRARSARRRHRAGHRHHRRRHLPCRWRHPAIGSGSAAWLARPGAMLLVVIPSTPAWASRSHSAWLSAVQTMASSPAPCTAPIRRRGRGGRLQEDQLVERYRFGARTAHGHAQEAGEAFAAVAPRHRRQACDRADVVPVEAAVSSSGILTTRQVDDGRHLLGREELKDVERQRALDLGACSGGARGSTESRS